MSANSFKDYKTSCFLCDWWWLILLIVVLIVVAILTRDLWLPLITGTPVVGYLFPAIGMF